MRLVPLLVLPLMCTLLLPSGRAQSTPTNAKTQLQNVSLVIEAKLLNSGDFDVTLTVQSSTPVAITQVQSRTLSGSGAIVGEGSSLPSPNAHLTVPATVRRFAVTVHGRVKDAAGHTEQFSFSRAVVPSSLAGVIAR